MGRKEDGASGHMQNPIFEESKSRYICKISKKPQACFCILGSGQSSHAPEAWAGLWEALEGLLAIALPAALGEKIGARCTWVQPATGCAAGISASSQRLVPLPWQQWDEDLVRFGVCLVLVCLQGDLPPSHCDFGRFVYSFGVILVGESPMTQGQGICRTAVSTR